MADVVFSGGCRAAVQPGQEEETQRGGRSDLGSSDENGPALPENTTSLWRPVGLVFIGRSGSALLGC